MIQDLLNGTKQTISLEVFPPKKEDEFEAAFTLMDKFGALKPDYISCTYGAGGSKSKKTTEICAYIQNQLHIDALAHLTCVGSTKESIDSVTKEYRAAGIKHILALRGDRPSYMDDNTYNSREFEYASELTSYLLSKDDFIIAGGCYPEKHFEAIDMEQDLAHLKAKVDCGASFLISQLFFDNDLFYRFVEKAIKQGIQVPISAGIMPITAAKQLGTTVSLSGSSVPKKMADIIATYGDHPEDMRKAGIEYAVNQILDLQQHGVPDIHIYSMNKPKTTAEIMEAIR